MECELNYIRMHIFNALIRPLFAIGGRRESCVGILLVNSRTRAGDARVIP